MPKNSTPIAPILQTSSKPIAADLETTSTPIADTLETTSTPDVNQQQTRGTPIVNHKETTGTPLETMETMLIWLKPKMTVTANKQLIDRIHNADSGKCSNITGFINYLLNEIEHFETATEDLRIEAINLCEKISIQEKTNKNLEDVNTDLHIINDKLEVSNTALENQIVELKSIITLLQDSKKQQPIISNADDLCIGIFSLLKGL